MVEVFQTNIDTEKKADFILEKLQIAFPDYRINFDLEDCDNILRMEVGDSSIEAKAVMELVKSYGYQISVLPDEYVPQNISISAKTPGF
ncbi:hypothetical protein [Salegentibacter sp. F14]